MTQADDDPPPVLARLAAALEAARVPFVHTRHEPVFTSAEAAAVRGADLHSGAKALILKDDEFFMAVMPADLSLDSPAVRSLRGTRKLRFASKEEVNQLTGLSPGSIPPFGSLFGLVTWCDDRLGDNQRINFNAGSHSDSFNLSYADYVHFENPHLARIAKTAD